MPETELMGDEFVSWWKACGEEQLAEILYWVWDPIGVNDVFPATRGEYSAYVSPILAGIHRGATADELADMLLRFERDHMGLGGRNARADEHRRVSEFILGWFEESTAYWEDRPDSNWREA